MLGPARYPAAKPAANKAANQSKPPFAANCELAPCQLCARRDQSMITGRPTRSRFPKEQVEYLFVANGRKSRRPVQVLGRLALGRSQFGQMRELELIPKFTGKSPSSAACAHPGSAASRRSVGGFLEGGGTAGGREKVEAGGVTRRLRYYSGHFGRKR